MKGTIRARTRLAAVAVAALALGFLYLAAEGLVIGSTRMIGRTSRGIAHGTVGMFAAGGYALFGSALIACAWSFVSHDRGDYLFRWFKRLAYAAGVVFFSGLLFICGSRGAAHRRAGEVCGAGWGVE